MLSIKDNWSVRLGSKAALCLGLVMFYNAQQRLGTDGLRTRMFECEHASRNMSN